MPGFITDTANPDSSSITDTANPDSSSITDTEVQANPDSSSITDTEVQANPDSSSITDTEVQANPDRARLQYHLSMFDAQATPALSQSKLVRTIQWEIFRRLNFRKGPFKCVE